ncbi:MAG: hypothetical protein NVS2B14_19720 [Chamaesiphon sp.]
MSEDIHSKQKISEPLDEPIPLELWSVDAYADKLMNDLFSDIDRILDDGSKLPTEPAQSTYVSLKIPQDTPPPPGLTPSEQAVNPSNVEPVPVDRYKNASDTPKSDRKTIRVNQFEKLLLGVAFASTAAVLTVWLASKYWLNGLLSQNLASSPNAQNTKISESDAQFSQYMMRSLKQIDLKTQATQQQATTAGMQVVPNQSKIPVSNNTVRSPTVLQRVYIPVYPPLPQSYAPTVSASPKPLDSVKGVVPIPTAAPTAPTSEHKLVGLVVKKGKSAAVFKFNGVTHWIHAGEKIGTSGWKLASLNTKKVIIQRNTEIRSIYLGYSF